MPLIRVCHKQTLLSGILPMALAARRARRDICSPPVICTSPHLRRAASPLGQKWGTSFAELYFYPLRVQFLFTTSQHLHSIYSVLTGLCPFKLPYGGAQPPLDPANALRAICFSAARKMLRQISNYIRPRRTVSVRKRKAQTPSGTTCHLPLRGRLISPPPGVVSTCRWHVGLRTALAVDEVHQANHYVK